jgi:alkylhydroperoxidase family enzyme
MAHIKLIEIEDAHGDLKSLYDDIQRVRGERRVSNLFKTYAAFPALARANWERLKVLLSQGSLSRKLKEAVMMATAEINGCRY